jgi:HSP20 family protein
MTGLIISGCPVNENDKAYTIRAEIPGAKKEDVKVQVDGNLVSISAETKQKKEKKEDGRVVCSECSQGSSYRSFTLDCNVNRQSLKTVYLNWYYLRKMGTPLNSLKLSNVALAIL